MEKIQIEQILHLHKLGKMTIESATEQLLLLSASFLELNKKSKTDIKSLADLKRAYPNGKNLRVRNNGEIIHYFVDREIKHTRYN